MSEKEFDLSDVCDELDSIRGLIETLASVLNTCMVGLSEIDFSGPAAGEINDLGKMWAFGFYRKESELVECYCYNCLWSTRLYDYDHNEPMVNSVVYNEDGTIFSIPKPDYICRRFGSQTWGHSRGCPIHNSMGD